MRGKLIVSGLLKLLLGFVFLALMIFPAAGTLRFPNGWLFLGILFVPMFFLGVVLLLKSPALLEKRLNGKEKESDQKFVVGMSGLIFLAGFLVAGLDFRFGWLPRPTPLAIAAAVIFLIAYALYAEVMRENEYLSRTIEVQEGQKVIDTGLYGIVRHPMYAVTVLLFLMIPLILGSLFAFLIFLAYPVVIAVRIRGEERVLEKELAGYAEYKKRVKWRLIPLIW